MRDSRIATWILVVASSSTAPAADFRQALAPREFSFPRDHGAHRGFKTEWWYFTGNLTDDAGRPFGFQLTWFRSQLTPQPVERGSRWAADEVFAAHAAISDIAGGRFVQADRVARGGNLGLAGASAETFDVHLGGWTGKFDARGRIVLSADAGGFGIDLHLDPRKPPVLQGPGGISAKGAAAGQASYYVSSTRLAATGTLRLGDRKFAVTGLAWMDHEFGSNQLAGGQVGWDWYGLVFDDGRELMVYSVRGAAGAADHRRATLVEADGKATYFAGDEVMLETQETWSSPHGDRAAYPVGRRIRIGDRIDLRVRPRLADQEMRTKASTGNVYYEGAAEAAGTVDGKPVSGKGYIELVGYAGPIGRL